MALLDIFVGVPQSKYAAIAVLLAVGIVSLAILFGKDSVPVGQKLLFIILMFVISLPGLLLALFQLTCLVTGSGLRNQRWWCGAYAWIATILLFVYTAMVIIVAVMSLVNGTNVITDLAVLDDSSFERMQDMANDVAKEYFQTEVETDQPERFMAPEEPEERFNPEIAMERYQNEEEDTFAVKGGASVPAPIIGAESFGNYALF
jgi:hypothetical protein